MSRVPVSVMIPTFNEQLNLSGCMQSVSTWADQVLVLDSFSTDNTVEIAKRYGAEVVQHAFEGYARQKNWGLDNLPIKHEWVLILDADERLTPELQQELADLVANDGSGCDGFYLNRRFIFYGKWIKHCGWYPSWNLRFFRARSGRYEDRQLHEHVILNGKVGYCKHDMLHDDQRDMSDWIAKHNQYSSKEAREIWKVLCGGSTGFKPSLFGGSVERKRFIKERVWPHLPGRAFFYFFYLYFSRLGFLDGKNGFVFCLMHAIFEEFNTIKLWEIKHEHLRQKTTAVGVAAEPTASEQVKAGK